MSIQNTVTKNTYKGDGTTRTFPYTFAMDDDHPEYIHVYITGTDGRAAETDDFTVDVKEQSVTYPKDEGADALSSGYVITVARELPLTQILNLVNQGPFFAEDLEQEYDDIVCMVQQLNEKLGRAIIVDIGATETGDELKERLFNAQDKAEEAATNAAESETNAKASEANAAESAESAAKSAEEAKNVSSIEDAIDKSETTIRGEIEDSKTELTNAMNAKIAELEKKIAEKNESQMTNLSYAQVTKLNTAQYKGVAIPIAENTSYVHPPFEVLKLRDDGVSETSTMCEFSNGDASDFAYDDTSAVIFSRGAMRLGTTFNAAMSEPVELVDGHVSESALIDLANWKSVLEVDVR